MRVRDEGKCESHTYNRCGFFAFGWGGNNQNKSDFGGRLLREKQNTPTNNERKNMTTQHNKNKRQLNDLPDVLIGEITKHLDYPTIIKLLPESYYPPGIARMAHTHALKREREHQSEMVAAQLHCDQLKELKEQQEQTRRLYQELFRYELLEKRELRQNLQNLQNQLEEAQQATTRTEQLLNEAREATRKREDQEKPLERMTVKEMKEECRQKGLRRYSALRRAVLVELCREARVRTRVGTRVRDEGGDEGEGEGEASDESAGALSAFFLGRLGEVMMRVRGENEGEG